MARFKDKLAEAPGSADESYYQSRQTALEMVGKIQVAITNHARQQRDDPQNWGYAGDMNHVVELLGQVYDFLSGEA